MCCAATRKRVDLASYAKRSALNRGHDPPATVLTEGKTHDLPDQTEEFLRALEPYGRFWVDFKTRPPTLNFDDDYD